MTAIRIAHQGLYLSLIAGSLGVVLLHPIFERFRVHDGVQHIPDLAVWVAQRGIGQLIEQAGFSIDRSDIAQSFPYYLLFRTDTDLMHQLNEQVGQTIDNLRTPLIAKGRHQHVSDGFRVFP